MKSIKMVWVNPKGFIITVCCIVGGIGLIFWAAIDNMDIVGIIGTIGCIGGALSLGLVGDTFHTYEVNELTVHKNEKYTIYILDSTVITSNKLENRNLADNLESTKDVIFTCKGFLSSRDEREMKFKNKE